jgi:hypothetical protein
MARKEPVCSPFENPACPTPDEGSGELGGQFGGYDLTDMPKETANMSGLRTLNSTLSVKEGPAPWSGVEIAGGVSTPTTPAGNIDKL